MKGIWDVVYYVPDENSELTITSLTDLRRIAERGKASKIIFAALGDAPLRDVFEADDDPERKASLLDGYASNLTVSCIAVQTEFFRMR